jgi:hypothetical protein
MLTARATEAQPGADFAANVMHVDVEAICPKCMQWVTPTDIVRRTAYGLIQHEACSTVASGVEFSSR